MNSSSWGPQKLHGSPIWEEPTGWGQECGLCGVRISQMRILMWETVFSLISSASFCSDEAGSSLQKRMKTVLLGGYLIILSTLSLHLH